MSVAVQVTFDCADPHGLARFWAAALGYEVEQHGPFVSQLVADGRITADQTVEVDGQPAFADVAAASDPSGKGPRLFFQKVPEPKTVKNRVHLDLHVGPDRVEAEAARLQSSGAVFLSTSDDRGAHTITLADPEGNELCVD